MRGSRVLVLGVMIVAAAGLLACQDPAKGKPEAVVGDATAPASDPDAPGAVFTIGEGSRLDFAGSKVTGSHEGGFNVFDGEIVLVDNDPTKSRVEIVIDTTSMWSDDERLTGHLKSADFFDVASFPTAGFATTAIEGAEGGFTLTGNLNLHGVTKSVSFPATIRVEEGQITADAEFSVKRFDFDIVYPGKAEDLIRDDVLVKLHLVATP